MKRKRFFIVSLCAALLAVGILITALSHKRQVLYRATVLPSLGGQFSLPCAINDRGQIAGFSEVAKGTYHLFLWEREKGMQDLGAVVNKHVHINNAGQIAATGRDPNGNERAFIWDADRGRCVLPTLGGDSATAHGINNHGEVIGASETASGDLHACVWDASSEIRDLTPSSKERTRAWSINDAGQVVVLTRSAKLLIDANEGMTSTSPSIPVLGVAEINSTGYVVGLSLAGQTRFNVVIWRPDLGLKRLAQLNTDSPGIPKMNDVGQVLFAKDPQAPFRLIGRRLFSHHAKSYLLDPQRGQISLDGYVSVGKCENLCLTDLNNEGCVVGAVQSARRSRSRGVILEPIPEQWNK